MVPENYDAMVIFDIISSPYINLTINGPHKKDMATL